uniref:Uncharacterized protein n=1 Tax=Aplanochytrium stocchinoi TaxID=215587 RepID=A0A7S3V0A6_9STRA|eukprot:CAMPEP_0204837864 /NCGR_PEP_ID=MMETSP1346-20131115/29294_1 /ASSEMBLY_ACC=CAM_ASM_000771 /TAXON_ID=215587 /ORGANISM="Aplanochytrium stocchinoi, Strain GSBS06" /LENGTH=376 /DNA_ID=CAMNT_0051973587 /DNA_START=86 /DNA_END=1216 /DNA_ORIENTATION=+
MDPPAMVMGTDGVIVAGPPPSEANPVPGSEKTEKRVEVSNDGDEGDIIKQYLGEEVMEVRNYVGSPRKVIAVNVDPNSSMDEDGFSVLVHFSDPKSKTNFSFRVDVKKDELDTLKVLGLKSRICYKVMSETEMMGRKFSQDILRPKHISLSINDAPLRDNWSCRDCGIHSSSNLVAILSHSAISGGISSTFADKETLFTLHVDIDGFRTEELHINSGDVPEQVVALFARENGLDAGFVPPLVGEVYKGLAKAFASEVRHLHAEMANLMEENVSLKQAMNSTDLEASRNHEIHAIESSRDYVIRSQEALLSEATNQIQRLEEDKQRLSRELFELRVSKAEAQNQDFGKLLRAANIDRERLVIENNRLRDMVYSTYRK